MVRASDHYSNDNLPSDATIYLSKWVLRVELNRLEARECRSLGRPVVDKQRYLFGPVTIYRNHSNPRVAYRLHPSPVCVVFDGYLAGTGGVAGKLGVCDKDPADVWLAAYLHWGLRAFDNLDGGFLVALWDGARGEFILGRDGMGKHPAYYARRNGRLWLSSNVLALSRRPDIDAQPDRLSILRRLVFRPPAAGMTFFSGIRRVRPGHFLRIESNGATEEKCHWRPLPRFDEPWLPDAEVLDRYEDVVTRAVDRCMDLGAGGVLLSGGTDSVSVAAVAAVRARARGLPVPTACCGKTPPGYEPTRDEFMQDRVTAFLGMPELSGHALDWLDGKDLIGASLSCTTMLPGPTTVYWMGAFCGFYGSIVRHGIHTAMSGSGGDEWMGVHDSHFIDLFWRMRFRQMYSFATALGRGRGLSPTVVFKDLAWRWAIRHTAGVYLGKLAPNVRREHLRTKFVDALPDWLRGRSEIADSVVGEARETTPADPGVCNGDRWYRSVLAGIHYNPFMHYELERRYHLGHALGLRLISPFQDREVVHFFNRISPATLLRTGRSKGLLREIIAKHIDDQSIVKHPKLYDGKRSYVEEQLGSHLARHAASAGLAAVRELGLVDVDKLKQAIRRSPVLPHTEAARVFGVLSADRWLKLQM